MMSSAVTPNMRQTRSRRASKRSTTSLESAGSPKMDATMMVGAETIDVFNMVQFYWKTPVQ